MRQLFARFGMNDLDYAIGRIRLAECPPDDEPTLHPINATYHRAFDDGRSRRTQSSSPRVREQNSEQQVAARPNYPLEQDGFERVRQCRGFEPGCAFCRTKITNRICKFN